MLYTKTNDKHCDRRNSSKKYIVKRIFKITLEIHYTLNY